MDPTQASAVMFTCLIHEIVTVDISVSSEFFAAMPRPRIHSFHQRIAGLLQDVRSHRPTSLPLKSTEFGLEQQRQRWASACISSADNENAEFFCALHESSPQLWDLPLGGSVLVQSE